MKKIYKLLILTIASTSMLFYSCETIELEDLANPNALTPTDTDPAFLFNAIQREYLFTVSTFNFNGGVLSRGEYLGNSDYFNFAGSGALDGAWNNLYADMLPDIAALKQINAANPDLDLSTNIAIAQIMEAHLLTLFVDYLGDIVWSQANNPNEFPNPILDDGASVYAAADVLLDEAKALLAIGAPLVGADLYGGPDWTKVANTIKMRIDLNLGNDMDVLNATNVITDAADDFQFTYGTNLLQPDNRHPDYAADYQDSGANIYRSNWLMNNMAGTWGDFFEDDDPRRRYYFYRQNALTPGNRTLLNRTSDGAFFILSANPNAETLECSGNAIFPQLEFTPEEDYWCSVKIGYWGRDHFNNEGTPPDGNLRTAGGVYPQGGLFDDHNDFMTWDGGADQTFVGYGNEAAVSLGVGGGGAGIEPIYLSHNVSFMKAIAAMNMSNPTLAATHLETAITQSIAKVQTFGSLDSSADLSMAPTVARITAFIADKVAEFNDAPATATLDANGFPVENSKMDVLGEEYITALFGGGADLFNFMRQTGAPATLPRGWEVNRGLFPRTFLYPGGEASTNPNVIQRTDTQTRVFWDQGVTNPAN